MRAKKRKSVKGMTLIECIIAILVFGVMALIMVRIGIVSKSMMINTNHLNNKIDAEAPVGAVRDINKLNEDASAASVTVEQKNVQFSVGTFGTVNAVEYSTSASAAKAESEGTLVDNSMQADLKFYVMSP